jgi:DNA-binding MarR family transcriptional regulator
MAKAKRKVAGAVTVGANTPTGSGPGAGVPARGVRYGPLTDYLGYALRRAQMAAVAQLVEAFEPVELRPTQFAVLTLIKENPGVRQTEVCEALGIQKANFVPLLNELERRGFTVRRAVIADRRSSALHLTQLGDTTLQHAAVLHEAYEEQFVARLGKRGRDQLLALLNKVMESG